MSRDAIPGVVALAARDKEGPGAILRRDSPPVVKVFL
jgi:hypothetical protein